MKELGDTIALQHGVGVRVAEEVGDGDQTIAKEGGRFRPIAFEQFQVLEQGSSTGGAHPAQYAPLQRRTLVVAQVVAGLAGNLAEERWQDLQELFILT